MDGVEKSGHVLRTPRNARDIKRKSKNKRKAEPQDVNELTTLYFFYCFFRLLIGKIGYVAFRITLI